MKPTKRLDWLKSVNACEELPSSAKCTAIALATCMNGKTGACHPSYNTIAALTTLHRTTVIDCIGKLESFGFVKRKRISQNGMNTANSYALTIPGVVAPGLPGGSSTDATRGSSPGATRGGGSQKLPGSSENRPGVVAQGLPKHSKNTGSDSEPPLGGGPDRSTEEAKNEIQQNHFSPIDDETKARNLEILKAWKKEHRRRHRGN